MFALGDTGFNMKLSDVQRLPEYSFLVENSVFANNMERILTLDRAVFRPVAAKGWKIIGWCNLPKPLGKDDNIAVMLFNKEHGEIWQHYPDSALNFELNDADVM